MDAILIAFSIRRDLKGVARRISSLSITTGQLLMMGDSQVVTGDAYWQFYYLTGLVCLRCRVSQLTKSVGRAPRRSGSDTDCESQSGAVREDAALIRLFLRWFTARRSEKFTIPPRCFAEDDSLCVGRKIAVSHSYPPGIVNTVAVRRVLCNARVFLGRCADTANQCSIEPLICRLNTLANFVL